jgi:flavodoxin
LTEYAKKEMQQNARPEIVGKVDNFEQYDTIFIGFPIWWGDKPMPVYTFLDSYDFAGKSIAPFCTHEGSGFCGTQGMDKTGAKVLNGLAIYGHTAQNDRPQADKKVSEWLNGLGF